MRLETTAFRGCEVLGGGVVAMPSSQTHGGAVVAEAVGRNRA